jgi:hypothetical protein
MKIPKAKVNLTIKPKTNITGTKQRELGTRLRKVSLPTIAPTTGKPGTAMSSLKKAEKKFKK